MIFNVLSRIPPKTSFIIDFFLPITSQVEIQIAFFKYTLEFENEAI